MEKLLIFCFSMLFLFVSMQDAKDTIGNCGRGSFKLSIVGRKQNNNKWNTTYDMERYNCKSTKNWNFKLDQNISDHGEMHKIHLRGFISDDDNESQLESTSPLIKTEEILELKAKIISQAEWNASTFTKEPPSLPHPVKKIHVYYSDFKCENNLNDTKTCLSKEEKDALQSKGYLYGNFYLGCQGQLYEGLGWYHSQDGELNLKYFDGLNPSLEWFAVLIHEGIRTGKIAKDFSFANNENPKIREWLQWLNKMHFLKTNGFIVS